MKQIYTFLILTFYPYLVFTQSLSIKGYLGSDLKDMVSIGIVNNGTKGIDKQLGESDILTASPQDFDLRVIQRDEISFDCLYDIESSQEYTPVYFEDVFDSKVNLRGRASEQNLFFEIKNLTKNFDRLQLNSSIPLNNYIKNIWTLNNCDFNSLLQSIPSDFPIPINILDFTLGSGEDNVSTMIIEFSPSVLTSSESINQIAINIYPNPAKDYINIQIPEYTNVYNATIINNLGILVKQIDNLTSNINLRDLPRGMYFLNIFEGKELVGTKKIIKE